MVILSYRGSMVAPITGTPEHTLSADEARRIAVRAQLLTAPRPDDLLELVRHLQIVQVEPTASVVSSAELVCWSRLGASYRRGDLHDAVATGLLVELRSMLRPAEDLALFRAEMAAWPGPEAKDWERSGADWVEANDGCRQDILDKLLDEGPLPSRSLPDTTVVPWQSSGWNNDRNVRMMLERMVSRGEIARAGYVGRERLWDLAERVYPDVEPIPYDEALRVRAARRLHSLGLARLRAAVSPGEPNDVGEVGEPARIEGVRGTWRVDPSYLDVAQSDDSAGPVEPRTVLLSPLDRLVFDRKRLDELWGFDYQLEMYKPAASRRWGYWALPVLHGADLVGKVDATAERDRGVLRVDAVHEDAGHDGGGHDGGGWPAALRTAVDEQIEDLADWLGLVVERT